MPYLPHYRVIGKGTLGVSTAPTEQFAFSVAMRLTDPGTFLVRSDMPAFAEALAPRFKVLVAGNCTSQVQLRGVRVARIDALGKYARDPSGAYVMGDTAPFVESGGGGSTHPFSHAVAISLQSLFPGQNGRGRFYLPLPAPGAAVDGLFLVASQTGLRDAAKVFLDGLNASAATFGAAKVCVASKGSVLKGIPGANHLVTSVRVGRVPDTMRSRRSALSEAYLSAVVA